MCGTLDYVSPATTFASVWAPFTAGLLAALPLGYRALTRPTLANHFAMGSLAIPVLLLGVVASSMLTPYGFVDSSYYMFDWPKGDLLYHDLWEGTRRGIRAFTMMFILSMGPGGSLGSVIWMLRKNFSKRILGCEAHRPAELPRDASAGNPKLRSALLVCSIIGWIGLAAAVLVKTGYALAPSGIHSYHP